MSSPKTQASDTPSAVESIQRRRWRAMKPAEKAETVRALVRACHSMAMAGARLRDPGASKEALMRRVAELWYGEAIDEDTPAEPSHGKSPARSSSRCW